MFTSKHIHRISFCFRRHVSTVVTGGVQGVHGRLPTHPSTSNNSSQSLSITDPYQLYQNYVALGLLEKDEAQVRVMKEFQKLYHRVLDYVPPEDLSIKLSLVLRQIEVKQAEQNTRKKSPLRYFKRIREKRNSHWLNTWPMRRSWLISPPHKAF